MGIEETTGRNIELPGTDRDPAEVILEWTADAAAREVGAASAGRS
jgi:hypothetical protein